VTGIGFTTRTWTFGITTTSRCPIRAISTCCFRTRLGGPRRPVIRRWSAMSRIRISPRRRVRIRHWSVASARRSSRRTFTARPTAHPPMSARSAGDIEKRPTASLGEAEASIGRWCLGRSQALGFPPLKRWGTPGSAAARSGEAQPGNNPSRAREEADNGAPRSEVEGVFWQWRWIGWLCLGRSQALGFPPLKRWGTPGSAAAENARVSCAGTASCLRREQEYHAPGLKRLSQMARAAGASFMGRSKRRRPSKA
jgi:hypothetical protein